MSDAEYVVEAQMKETDSIDLDKNIKMRVHLPGNEMPTKVRSFDISGSDAPLAGGRGSSDFGQSLHSQCIVCGWENDKGLHLSFQRVESNGVEATIGNLSKYEGYPGTLHGGMIALLLDGAMTNCLFSLGKAAVTALLSIRYKLPVMTDKKATIQARLTFSKLGLYKLQAWIIQGGRVCVQATGKFIEKRPPLLNYPETPGIVKVKREAKR